MNMQPINWDLLKEKLKTCWDEHCSYLREFKMRNGNIVSVSKYTHTGFKVLVLNPEKTVLWSPHVEGPEDCYDVIYSLMNM